MARMPPKRKAAVSTPTKRTTRSSESSPGKTRQQQSSSPSPIKKPIAPKLEPPKRTPRKQPPSKAQEARKPVTSTLKDRVKQLETSPSSQEKQQAKPEIKQGSSSKFKSKETIESSSSEDENDEDDDGDRSNRKQLAPKSVTRKEAEKQGTSSKHKAKETDSTSASEAEHEDEDDDHRGDRSHSVSRKKETEPVVDSSLVKEGVNVCGIMSSNPKKKAAVSTGTSQGTPTIRTTRPPESFTGKMKQGTSSKHKGKETDATSASEAEHEEEDDDHRGDRSHSVSRKKETEPVVDSSLVKEGMNVFGIMSTNPKEIDELLERIDQECSPLDRITSKRKEKTLDWEKIAFSSYGPRQCEAVWSFLSNATRNFRILSEVVEEVRHRFSGDKVYQTGLIEKIPGYPEKPTTTINGFHYFNRQEWDKLKSNNKNEHKNFVRFQRECRERYEGFSAETKQMYDEKSKTVEADYKRQVKQFYAENPGLAQYVANLKESHAESQRKIVTGNRASRSVRVKLPRIKKMKKVESLVNPYEDAPQLPSTPAALFMESRLSRIEPPPMAEELTEMKHKFMDKWKKLSDNKRVKWIDVCIKKCSFFEDELREYQQIHPEYSGPNMSDKIVKIVSKEEISLWEHAIGKPQTPKPTVFDLFYDEFLTLEENAEIPGDQQGTVAKDKWNHLDWYSKQMYTVKFNVQNIEYRKQLQNFFSALPNFLKEYCKRRIHKKFHKLLDEIDKIPPHAETESILPDLAHEEDFEQGEETREPSPKRRKKDKKKRREQEEANHFESSTETESNYITYQTEFDPENFESDTQEVKKKKKKKKRHAQDEHEGFDYHQSDYNYNADEDEIGPSSRSFNPYEKATKHGKAALQKVKQHGQQDVYDHSTREEMQTNQQQLSSKHFKPTNSVTHNDMFDAARGIFDARAHLGRKFTPYYYYAKFVATEKFWIDSVVNVGLDETALSIIKTFLELPNMQKDHFIEWSYRFEKERRHGVISINGRNLFPGEPKPPPRRAWQLFLYDKQRQSQSLDTESAASTWLDLPDSVQLYYIKQLYHQNKLYMKLYDKFIASLTPSDLVLYAVYRAEKWEDQLYTQQAIAQASKQFTFHFSKKEHEEDRGLDSEPEVLDVDDVTSTGRPRRKCRLKKSNPFTEIESKDKIRKIIKNMPPKKVKRRKARDSDDPTDNEELGFSLLFEMSEKVKKKHRVRKRLQARQKYHYGVTHFLKSENVIPRDSIEPTAAEYKHTLNESVQTDRIKVHSIGIQTEISGLGAKGKIIGKFLPTLFTEEQNNQKRLCGGKFQKIACNVIVPYGYREETKKVLKTHLRKTITTPKSKPQKNTKSSKSISDRLKTTTADLPEVPSSGSDVAEHVTSTEKSSTSAQEQEPTIAVTESLHPSSLNFLEPLTPMVEYYDTHAPETNNVEEVNTFADLTNVPLSFTGHGPNVL